MPPCDRSISLDYPSFKKLGCSRYVLRHSLVGGLSGSSYSSDLAGAGAW